MRSHFLVENLVHQNGLNILLTLVAKIDSMVCHVSERNFLMKVYQSKALTLSLHRSANPPQLHTKYI